MKETSKMIKERDMELNTTKMQIFNIKDSGLLINYKND